MIMRDTLTEHNHFLYTKYNKTTLSKKELAREFGISIRTLNNYIHLNMGIPNYIKLGDKPNSKIVFPIPEVIKFLDRTTLINTAS